MDRNQLEEISAIIDKFSVGDGIHGTAIPGVNCIRLSELHARLPSVYKPSACVIVQGRKQVLLKEEIYAYRPSEYLAVSVDLPLVSEVTEGSMEKPYLCLQIELDQRQLAEVLLHAQLSPEARTSASRGIFIGTMDGMLSDCVTRLARLLEAPQDIPCWRR